MNTTSRIDVLLTAPPFNRIAGLAMAVLLVVLLVPSAPAQYIWIANAGEDTVSKIDINSNTEVARYPAWFTTGTNHVVHTGKAWEGPAPSRIVEDRAGYVYVLNRFFGPNYHRPVLLKIAPFGGTTGTTSNGAGPSAVLPMLDNGSTPNEIDAGDTKDARIVWGKSIGVPGVDDKAYGRALCIDTNGFLWVGMWDTRRYYKVDPATGNTVGMVLLDAASTNSTNGQQPYGCQVDSRGRLWSVCGTVLPNNVHLVEIDTTAVQPTVKLHNHGAYGANYSLSIFDGCGWMPTKVYLSEWNKDTYMAYDTQVPLAGPTGDGFTSGFSYPPTTGVPPVPRFKSRAVAVDLNGHILSADAQDPLVVGSAPSIGQVIKSDQAGNLLWNTNTLPAGPTVKMHDPRGIVVDEKNDVWVVSRLGTGVIPTSATGPGEGTGLGYIVKYSGSDGHYIATVGLGDSPYTYVNPPPPTCLCASISEKKITCERQKDGTTTYTWSFTVTNNNPMLATGVDLSIPSSSAVTALTPTHVQFPNPLSQGGQSAVSGTFTVANPVPGSELCFDLTLAFGEKSGCCPPQPICFDLPECPTCAKLESQFKCKHGNLFLSLSITNLGPTVAQGAQIFSNTPGVTVSPQTITLTFPQNNMPILVPPLIVTGAAPGQLISLSVMLHGPIDPKTGVNSWCCTATFEVTYPTKECFWLPAGDIFDDVNANGLRDSGEVGLAEWTVTLTDAKGTPRTTKSEGSGAYQFEEIEPGKYRLTVQPLKGWRATKPKGGVQTLSVEAPPKEKLDFGFVKAR
jgi:hypothetical protein